jgi:transcriptional regulator with XRE-family HTH domain/flagellar basal body-associated protein FliL
MSDMSFGEILRQTRERKGLDLYATARRLRIRPDILRAIEEGNFAAMPPRGYTRNMVNGYARYLGLNPTDITGMYIDELYAYQSGISRAHQRGTGFDMSAAPENTRFPHRGGTSRLRASDQNLKPRRQQRDGASRRQVGRKRNEGGYMDRLESMERSRGVPQVKGKKVGAPGRVSPSRGSVLPPQSFVGQSSSARNADGAGRSKLPFIIAAAVILVIVIIVCSFLFSHKSESSSQATSTMPVTGLSESGSSASDTSASSSSTTGSTSSTTTEVASTQGEFTYTVADGGSTYIEVYVDGTNQEADTVEGPATKQYTFTDTLQIICVDTTSVTVTVNGEEQTLEPNSNGIVNVTYEFSDILAEWKSAHPDAVSDTASSTSTATTSSTSE